MKIIFLDFDDYRNPLLGAGQAKATLEVGSRLARRGHTIEVITSRYPGSKNRIDNGIFYHHIGLGSNNIRLNNACYILCLPWYVTRLKGHIIIECFTAPISTLFSQLFTSIPVVGLPTSFEADRFSKLYKLPFDQIEKLGLKTYKYFLPYTKHFDNKIKRYNPKVLSKIVPEGVGDEFFSYPIKEPKHILFIGRYDIEQKGLDLLIKAYAKVANKIHYPLVIAGHGPDEMKMRALVGRLHMNDRITILGSAFGDKKKKLMSEALFIAFPSRHEGFSLFSLEALASGHALAGFNIPGLSWANNDIAYKAKSFDIDEYALILKKLCNKTVTGRMGKKARVFARKYTWNRVADLFEIFFNHILKMEKLI
jgi:glycosyltransferase involved in cell wall biosynthesis